MDDISDMYLYVQREVGDQGAIFINTDDIIRWANQGVVDIIRKAELDNFSDFGFGLAKDATTIFLSNRHLYRIEFLKCNETNSVIEETDFTQLQYNIPGFRIDGQSIAGPPQYWWMSQDPTTPVLNVYPKADKAYTILIRGSEFKTAYSTLADPLTMCLPESYKYDLLQFCLIRAYARAKDHQSEDSATKEYMQNLTLRYGEAKSKSAAFDTIGADEYDGYSVGVYYGDL